MKFSFGKLFHEFPNLTLQTTAQVQTLLASLMKLNAKATAIACVQPPITGFVGEALTTTVTAASTAMHSLNEMLAENYFDSEGVQKAASALNELTNLLATPEAVNALQKLGMA